MLSIRRKTFVFLGVFLTLLVLGVTSISAGGFSGSNLSNYYCLTRDGVTPPVRVSPEGDYVCDYNGDGVYDGRAVPKPPSSRQLQFWFVRILYVIWAVAGIIFTIVLFTIGFQYLTSFGNEVALADVVKKFRKWIVGLGLVILAYPLLNTFFGVLGLRESECLSDLQLPGFQFFFAEACVLEPQTYNECVRACVNAGGDASNCGRQCSAGR